MVLPPTHLLIAYTGPTAYIYTDHICWSYRLHSCLYVVPVVVKCLRRQSRAAADPVSTHSLPPLPMIDASKKTLLFAVYANQWGSRPSVSRRLRCGYAYYFRHRSYRWPLPRTRRHSPWIRLGGTYSTRSRSTLQVLATAAVSPQVQTTRRPPYIQNIQLPVNKIMTTFRKADRKVGVYLNCQKHSS